MQNTKIIKLVNGGETLVDADDYEYLSQFKWYRNGGGYAYRQWPKKDEDGNIWRQHVFIHRLVNKTPAGLYTDHANQNRLDNRKCNLRTVDKSRNAANRPKRIARNGKAYVSAYKGVGFNKGSSLWEASVRCNGKSKTTYHKTEAQAALDYNRMANEAFGEYACLNTIPEGTIATVRTPKSSKFIGVCFVKRTQKWRASIQIGHYDTDVEAARAYNNAASLLRGDRAKLNVFPT